MRRQTESEKVLVRLRHGASASKRDRQPWEGKTEPPNKDMARLGLVKKPRTRKPKLIGGRIKAQPFNRRPKEIGGHIKAGSKVRRQ